MSYITRLLICCWFCLHTNLIFAESTDFSLQQTDHFIAQLYHSLNHKPKQEMTARLVKVSGLFLNKPYLLTALGEGQAGDFDQAPLYRIDAFDCETYVDTVLALAFANNLSTFQHCIRQIRYREGHVSFIDRNHFTCLDWNRNNQQQQFLQDITLTIRDQFDHPVAKMATSLIDKPSWYQHFTLQKIRLPQASTAEQAHRLQQLKQQGLSLPKTRSSIPYIPLTALFDRNNQANEQLLQQIPQAAIIEIVRPNWDLSAKIGTHLNVSHLGFAIWHRNQLFFRQASSTQARVVDVLLIDYLRAAKADPTIQGINIQVALPQQPFANQCRIDRRNR